MALNQGIARSSSSSYTSVPALIPASSFALYIPHLWLSICGPIIQSSGQAPCTALYLALLVA